MTPAQRKRAIRLAHEHVTDDSIELPSRYESFIAGYEACGKDSIEEHEALLKRAVAEARAEVKMLRALLREASYFVYGQDADKEFANLCSKISKELERATLTRDAQEKE